MNITVKPIFQCDAKIFAVGPRVGGLTQFRFGNTNMMVSKHAKIVDNLSHVKLGNIILDKVICFKVRKDTCTCVAGKSTYI